MSHIPAHVTHVPCHAVLQCVALDRRDVVHVDAFINGGVSHGTHMGESCHTYEIVMSHSGLQRRGTCSVLQCVAVCCSVVQCGAV